MSVSIVIPVINEAENLARLLPILIKSRCEIIVVDAGSSDNTLDTVREFSVTLLVADDEFEKGRAMQMNKGAKHATGDILLFLHADSAFPQGFESLIDHTLDEKFICSKLAWGRFDVRLSGRHLSLRVIEFMMNWRSRITALATGDQAIFVRKSIFEQVGGFPSIPLMEDIAISKKLRRISRPFCVHTPLTTSSRRWEEKGIFRTVRLMWKLRFLYFLGVAPEKLSKLYR